jgi:threonyl-tRNA synthetase
MIHRALFGSVERFFGVLTEHYAGHFPPWLAPVQVVAVPITEAFSSYLHDFVSELRSSGVRAQVDDSDDRMQKKIRNHTMAKVPFILIAGAEDIDAGAVSFRFRDGSQENGIPLAAAKQRILDAISQKVQV